MIDWLMIPFALLSSIYLESVNQRVYCIKYTNLSSEMHMEWKYDYISTTPSTLQEEVIRTEKIRFE